MNNNIKNSIIYVSIKGDNGLREVREARITKLIAAPSNIIVRNSYNVVASVYYPVLNVEIAGIGEVSLNWIRQQDANLYHTEDNALRRDNPLFSDILGSELDIYWANLKVSDLNFKHKSVFMHTEQNNFRPFTAYSWYWEGTRAVRETTNAKFSYDFVENRIVEYTNDRLDKLGTLYADKEACEKANTPKVVRFNARPKVCEAVVKFEITRKVTIPYDCDDDECEAIMQGVKLIKSMTDDELFNECTEFC